jgi:hypothetical protein
LQLGRTREARAALTRAIALYEKTLAPDAPDLAEPLLRLGQLELKEHRGREALKPLERALLLRQKDATPTEMLADVELALAAALDAAHGDRLRARALAEQARAAWVQAGDAKRAESAAALLAQLAR